MRCLIPALILIAILALTIVIAVYTYKTALDLVNQKTSNIVQYMINIVASAMLLLIAMLLLLLVAVLLYMLFDLMLHCSYDQNIYFFLLRVFLVIL